MKSGCLERRFPEGYFAASRSPTTVWGVSRGQGTFDGPSGEGLRAVASALDVAPCSVVKWSQRLRGTASCAPAGTGGLPPRKIAAQHKAWLPERIKTPFPLRGPVVELAGRGPVVELAGRGVKVACRSVRAFVHRTGYSFKKDPARRGAGPPRYSALETASGPDRAAPVGLHRRNMGENQHGPAARSGAQRRTPDRARSARALAHPVRGFARSRLN